MKPIRWTDGAARWISAIVAALFLGSTLGGCLVNEVIAYQNVKKFVAETTPMRDEYKETWRPDVDRQIKLLVKITCILAADKHLVIPECREELSKPIPPK